MLAVKMEIVSEKKRHSKISVRENIFRPPPNSAPGLRHWYG